jgi:uncharacterized MAPEG superfamily protein
MTFAFWCVLCAGLLPVLTVAVAKGGMRSADNAAPRAWLERQQGMRQRADYAHRNHFEAFPFFAAAVLVAALAHAPQGRVDMLAGAFIGLRLIYTGLYLGNLPSLRSAAWTLAYLCILAIFVVAARG